MATFILLPDGTVIGAGNQWKNADGSGTANYNDCDNDNDDTDYIKTDDGTNSTDEVTFTFANSSQSGIASITSVQIKFKARNTSNRNNFVKVSQTGTSISNGTDTITVAGTLSNNTYTLYSGTAETTYDGSTAWDTDLTQINNLQVNLEKFRNNLSGTHLRISYLYAEVTYVEPTAGYSNNVAGIDDSDIRGVNGILTANIRKVNEI